MERPQLFENGALLDAVRGRRLARRLLVEGGRIGAWLEAGEPAPAGVERIDLDGGLLAPGLLDVHFHGSLVLAGPGELEAALRRDSASLARHGITAFVPTTVAWSGPELAERVTILAELLTRADWPGALPVGIHLEGPWINPAAAGAQPVECVRAYDPAEGIEVLDRGQGWIRMVTLAPEMPRGMDLVEALAERGVVAALGHTLASPEQVRGAVERGMTHVTHLFNAMGGMHSRGPGPAAAALAEERLSCDLICDGVHVHPDWVRVAARVKGDALMLISDRVALPEGQGRASFGSGELVESGGVLRLPDGRLAGSRLTLDAAARNVAGWGALSLEEGLAACSLGPARLLGLERERGTLSPGARADLVALDAAGRVRSTWVAGRRVV